MAILAISLTIYVPLSYAVEPPKTYSKKQVLVDIKQLVGLLKKNHPNLYSHQSPKKFKATIKTVKGELPNKLSRLDAAIQFQKILASVCDEHTRIVFSPKNELSTFKSASYLESSLILRQGRIVFGNSKRSTNSDVVLEIANRSADEITEYLQSLQNNDGCLDKKTHVINGIDFQNMMFIGNLFKDDLQPVSVEKRIYSGVVKGILRSVNYSDASVLLNSFAYFDSLRVFSILARDGFEYDSGDFKKDLLDRKISSYLFNNKLESVFFLKIESFLGGKKWSKEIEQKLGKIISANPSHLIIDLTNNPGGQLLKAGELLSFLLPKAHRPARYVRVKNPRRKLSKSIVWKSNKRKKNLVSSFRQFRNTKPRKGQYRLRYRKKTFGHPDFKGKLTVLVSPNSRSAATTVAMILKTKRKATIAGYSNGSSMKTACYDPAGSHKLKHTNILVDIPFTCFDREPLKSTSNGKLEPDIVVNPMVLSSSRLSGEIVRAALKEIRSQQ